MTDTAESDDPVETDDPSVTRPTDLKFVGPATADVIEAAEFDATDVAAKRVSYRMLVEADVNPGVAGKIRRWHSLSYSFASGSGLDRRSEQVRGLQADERAWVAASSGDWAAEADAERRGDEDQPPGDASDESTTGGDWTPGDWADTGASGGDDAPADGSGDAVAAESTWRERSEPTPVTAVSGLDSDDADTLAVAGVTSVRSLATCTPELVADLLELDPERVEEWHRQALDLTD